MVEGRTNYVTVSEGAMGDGTQVDTEELRRLEADIRRRTAAGIDPSPSEARALLTALDAAQAEAARERRGREVAEAREAYLMARFMPTSEPGADDRRDAAYARLCEVESAIGAEVGR
jgi:hypothetical protein